MTTSNKWNLWFITLVLFSGLGCTHYNKRNSHLYSHDLLKADETVRVRLYVMDCGTVVANDLSLFNPMIQKGTKMKMAVPCYLIVHPSGKTVMWDAGINDDVHKSKTGIPYYGDKFRLYVTKTLNSQLKEVNYPATSIDYFIPSHLHIDHSGNSHLFKNSTLVMQKSTHGLAFSKNAHKHAMAVENYKELKSSKTLLINGDYDLFGDQSVIILSTPGHSVGHQSLLVNLKQEGSVILSGDLYHFQKNRDFYGIPVWNDKKASIKAFARVDDIIDHLKAQLWIQHDPIQFKKMKLSPQYYE